MSMRLLFALSALLLVATTPLLADSASTETALGMHCLALRDGQAASGHFQRAVKLNDRNAQAWFGIGLAAALQSQWTSAVDAYTQSLERQPNDPAVVYNRACAYYSNGQFSAAEADYRLGTSLTPGDVENWRGLGMSCFAQSRYPPALAACNHATSLRPRDARLYLLRGDIWRATGKTSSAYQDYSKAIALNPQEATAYNNRGVLLAEAGKMPPALADLRRAVHLDPTNAAFLHNLAGAYLQAGRREDASRTYAEFLRQSDSSRVAQPAI